MSFKSMKLGTKILSGFTVILIVAISIGMVGFSGLGNVGTAFHTVADESIGQIHHVGQMESSLERLSAYYTRLLDTQLNQSEREYTTSAIQALRAQYRQAEAQFRDIPRDLEQERIYQRLVAALEAWDSVNSEQIDPAHRRFLAIDLMDPVATNRDLERFMKDMARLQIRVLGAIEDMQALNARFEDPARSSFGEWLPEFRTGNEQLNGLLVEMREYHSRTHASVALINEAISRGDRVTAMAVYNDEMVPATTWGIRMFNGFNAIAEDAVEALAEMSRLITGEGQAAQDLVVQELAQLRELTLAGAAQQVQQGDQIITRTNVINLIAILTGAIIAVVLGLLVTRQVTGGVRQGVDLAKRIADGDLTVRADQALLGRKDEIGELVQAMDRMADKLREILGSVVTGAANITAASVQTASTAQSLSQGASEQAASVEETTASVEQMSASIEQNMENAKVTDTMATKAANDAVEGGEAVRKTMDAMKLIADKIAIIDDIAYQTNLLALNAAIEAARAGDHGKGFAVVATEVRKLAERSQVASQEIGQVAKGSVQLAVEAGKLLDEIVPAIQKTSDLVQEISAASTEQSSGANQINQAMEQLNAITQQSASASEELASTSEEMSGQARKLEQLVSFFKIDSDATQVRSALSMKVPSPTPPVPRKFDASAMVNDDKDDAGFVRF